MIVGFNSCVTTISLCKIRDYGSDKFLLNFKIKHSKFTPFSDHKGISQESFNKREELLLFFPSLTYQTLISGPRLHSCKFNEI